MREPVPRRVRWGEPERERLNAMLGQDSVFQKHGFFAGRWPVKAQSLTSIDDTMVCCPEAESIQKTGVRVVIHEQMSETYVQSVAAAIRKIAGHYYTARDRLERSWGREDSRRRAAGFEDRGWLRQPLQ